MGRKDTSLLCTEQHPCGSVPVDGRHRLNGLNRVLGCLCMGSLGTAAVAVPPAIAPAGTAAPRSLRAESTAEDGCAALRSARHHWVCGRGTTSSARRCWSRGARSVAAARSGAAPAQPAGGSHPPSGSPAPPRRKAVQQILDLPIAEGVALRPIAPAGARLTKPLIVLGGSQSAANRLRSTKWLRNCART